MPQLFQVLRCYKCFVFQVHQTKKSNKWVCKLCGEKQSVKRHYGLGTGKECRQHVQKLNGLKGAIDQMSNSCSSEDEDSDKSNKQSMVNVIVENSKWSKYTDRTDEQVSDETEYMDGKEVVLEMPEHQSRKRFSKNSFKSQGIEAKQMKTVKPLEESSVETMHLYKEEVVSEETRRKSQIFLKNNIESQKNMSSSTGIQSDYYRSEILNEMSQENLSELRFAKHNINKESRLLTSKKYKYPSHKHNDSTTLFEPIKTKSDSKWAQYINNDECDHNEILDAPKENENNDNFIKEISMQNPIEKNTNNLFALCEDGEDLDNILNI